MANTKQGEFKFILSTDITQKVKIKISHITGRRYLPHPSSDLDVWMTSPYIPYSGLYTNLDGARRDVSDLYVSCVLFAEGKPLCLPELTSHKPFINGEYRWDETLTLPLKYCELPLLTQVVITVWDIFGPRQATPVGGTTFFLFGKNATLRKGRQKLVLWEGKEGDGSKITSTPGKAPKLKELDRLEKLQKRYDRGLIQHVDWLDSYTREQISKISATERDRDPNSLFLFVECPEFEYPVVFRELKYPVASSTLPSGNTIVLVYDSELNKDNPVENKYLKLVRSNRLRNLLDRDLKPGSKEREQINTILKYPPTKHLSEKEKEVMWRFRYYLSQDPKALSKFLRCVDFSDANEAKQGLELMVKWAPIGIDDALELLSFNFQDEQVRHAAVERLRSADDEELRHYLLQLVQAMKYEKLENISNAPLTSFLITRGVSNFQLGCYLHWYLTVESCLTTSKYANLYRRILNAYNMQLQSVVSQKAGHETLRQQDWLVTRLSALVTELKASRLDRMARIERMRVLLSPGSEYGDLSSFAPMTLPVNPFLEVVGIAHENAHIYKSAKAPVGLRFKLKDGGQYAVMFKTGDDLRQDQLIIQLISLMDRLLKKENLDLKLTPYKVIATAEEDGMVELVTPSEPLASVLRQYDGDIRKFLRTHNPDDEGPFGISHEVIDNFVKSCAGYCVITYILGIGDRHLDNLLLTPNGNLFHIDFGYILGNDPKVLPPPMKLCKEMVEGMGGANSKHYLQFKQFCCEAYNILRKSANLILNLFSLMVDANIPNISIDPEKSILKVQEKFRLELTDEEASQTLLLLLNESVSALFPVINEYVHKWAQYWRS
eukprot:TRINITY_DN6326_c0_g1_i1.p1 TRINITY_DN6326_c0_g1~~TRINITY_DN6326_c0_g1_i1.p1  ORF type:complete len:834 (-),score=158.90 TRINITY_DN6326_c0_g1_i1:116-2617(-)